MEHPAGFICWWNLSGLTIFDVEVQKALSESNLLIGIPPRNPREAFTKALQDIKILHRNKDCIIRKIPNKPGRYVILIRSSKGFSRKATIIFQKKKGVLKCSCENYGIIGQLRERFEFYKKHYSSDDIREFVVQYLEKHHATSLRENGGVYFVPLAYGQELEVLNQFISKLPGAKFYSVQVNELPALQAALFDAVRSNARYRYEFQLKQIQSRKRMYHRTLDSISYKLEKIIAYLMYYRDNFSLDLTEEISELSDLWKDIKTKLEKVT